MHLQIDESALGKIIDSSISQSERVTQALRKVLLLDQWESPV